MVFTAIENRQLNMVQRAQYNIEQQLKSCFFYTSTFSIMTQVVKIAKSITYKTIFLCSFMYLLDVYLDLIQRNR
jgi:hypothetical protein